MSISFDDWRTGDQYYYVSDISKFSTVTGWKPRYDIDSGIQTLMEWLCDTRDLTLDDNTTHPKALAL